MQAPRVATSPPPLESQPTPPSAFPPTLTTRKTPLSPSIIHRQHHPDLTATSQRRSRKPRTPHQNMCPRSQCSDDARHVRELETRLSEAESFVARPKLRAKLNSQQTELIATRRELADVQQLSQLPDSRVLGAQEHLEMAILDKEVAEERAEIAEAGTEELREKLVIVQGGSTC